MKQNNSKIEKMIKKSVDNNKLKLVAGKRNWKKYILNITELCHARNNYNGYIIDVFDQKESQLVRIYV